MILNTSLANELTQQFKGITIFLDIHMLISYRDLDGNVGTTLISVWNLEAAARRQLA